MSRQSKIKNILNSIVPPELKAGWDRAHEWGEGYRPETERFKTGPYGYSVFQGGPLKPNLTPEEAAEVMGYRGAFKGRDVLKDSQGNPMLDQDGQQLRTSANREYDGDGNFSGFETITDDLTGEIKQAQPTGPMYGLGYTLGRAGIDWNSNSTLGQYWTWNHPLGSASSMARNVIGNSDVAQGNRNTPFLSAIAPSMLMGAAAGNVAVGNILSGEDMTGRAPGTQSIIKVRKEDGTIDKAQQTKSANALTEVALRYLGRSGYVIDDYSKYFEDMLSNDKIPVDKQTWGNFRSQQFESRNPSNLYGLVKVSPPSPITGEAQFSQLGYAVPVSAAASLGGGLTAMGGMSRLMKDNPSLLGGVKGSTRANRRGAALMGAAMATGGVVGNVVGQGANDLIQRVVNPRNHAFQEQIKEELKRRKGFIEENKA